MTAFETTSSDARRPRRDAGPRINLDKLFDRLPPHSLEAEMSLLGSMILDPNVVADVLSFIKKPEDFYKQSHAAIYKALVDIYDRHHSGDLVQLVDYLRDNGTLESAGGPDYLVELASAVPSAINAPHYAKIVAEKARLRRLIDAAGNILYDSFHTGDLGPEGAREVLDRAEMAVFEIAQESESSDPQRLSDLLQLEIERLEAAEGQGVTGIHTGYAELDGLTSGLQPGEMIVIAARPSMGKTALALNIAEQIAFGGHVARVAPPGSARVPVAVFSLEMSKSAVTQRLLSAASGVDSHRLRGGQFSDSDFRDILRISQTLGEAPLFVDDTPNMTVLTLRARARRLVAQHGVKAIMVDYLQLLTAPGAARESRQVEVSSISRQIKALARELNIPVVCLSQLNRASEQREGNRPRMSDLRESGSIEQDADVIVLLHREDYYHTQDSDWTLENPDKVGVAELIIAKQRNGPTGIVKLAWDSHTTRFKNYAAHASPPGDYGYGGSGGFAGSGNRADAHGSYQSPSGAAASFGGPAPFAPGKKSGPVGDFRDGGGPTSRDDEPDAGFGSIPV